MSREGTVLESAKIRVDVSKEVDEADETKHRTHDGEENDTYHLKKKNTTLDEGHCLKKRLVNRFHVMRQVYRIAYKATKTLNMLKK